MRQLIFFSAYRNFLKDRTKKFRLSSSFGIVLLLLSGCGLFSPYHTDLQQGAAIHATAVNQLKIGMSAGQVETIMHGKPIIEQTFTQQRWVYLYLLEPSKGKRVEQRVVLTFDANQQLIDIES